MNEYEEYMKAREEYENSEQLKIYRRIIALDRSFSIAGQNLNELSTIYKEYNENIIPLWRIDNRDGLNQYLDEVGRRLFNYIGSVGAWIDHNQKIIKSRYRETVISSEYVDKVKRHFDHPSFHFLQYYRNYCFHVNHFSLTASLRFGSNGVSHVYIDTKNFLDVFDEPISVKTKEYLENHAAKIDVLEIALSYWSAMSQFQNWFIARIKEYHQDELNWLYSKNEELVNFQKKAFSK